MAYNEGTSADFLVVELRGGRLRVAVDDGSGNTTWEGRRRLDDGRWHLLELLQDGHKQFNISVDDDAPATLAVPDHVDRRNVFDMVGPLFVGGLPAGMLQLRPPHGLAENVNGFVGCLATLTVNGVLEDPTASLTSSAVSGCRSKQSTRSTVTSAKEVMLSSVSVCLSVNRITQQETQLSLTNRTTRLEITKHC